MATNSSIITPAGDGIAADAVSFTPDRGDVESVQAAQLERLEDLGRSSSYTLILIGLALVVPMSSFVAAGLMGYQSPFRDDAALAVSIGFAAGLVAHLFISRFVQRSGFRRQASLMPQLLKTQTVSLSSRGLDVRAEGVGTTFAEWTTIDDAQMSERHIFVWQGPSLIAYVPLSAFESPADADRFSAEIVRRAKHARKSGDANVSAGDGRRP